jgi:surface protein
MRYSLTCLILPRHDAKIKEKNAALSKFSLPYSMNLESLAEEASSNAVGRAERQPDTVVGDVGNVDNVERTESADLKPEDLLSSVDHNELLICSTAASISAPLVDVPAILTCLETSDRPTGRASVDDDVLWTQTESSILVEDKTKAILMDEAKDNDGREAIKNAIPASLHTPTLDVVDPQDRTIAMVSAQAWTETPLAASDEVELPDHHDAPTTTESTQPKEESPARRTIGWRWGGLLVLLAVAAAIVGGVCGSRNCRLLKESQSSNMASPNVSIGEYSQGTVAFTSTLELYQAADEYMKAGGGGPDASQSAPMSPVALRYGYPIGTWNVSLITDFTRVFDPDRNATLPMDRTVSAQRSMFNEDLSGWNVSSATTMVGMFAWAERFNGNISTWQTSMVTNMSYMFYHATRFAGNLSGWDVGRVQDARFMFSSAASFSSDVSQWNISSLQNMYNMFYETPSFESDLSAWDTSNVVTMRGAFAYSAKFSSDISAWNVGKVTDMFRMFSDANLFNGDLSNWDVSRVTNMYGMFGNTKSFDGRSLSS